MINVGFDKRKSRMLRERFRRLNNEKVLLTTSMSSAIINVRNWCFAVDLAAFLEEVTVEMLRDCGILMTPLEMSPESG